MTNIFYTKMPLNLN